jgi:hypothetical protein
MTIASGVLRGSSKSPRIALGPFALFFLAFMFTPKAHAAGVVGVCDEAHFLAAVAGGGSVTFSCSGTISLTHTVNIGANTIIDGTGQSVTFTDGGASNLFFVAQGCPADSPCTLEMRYVSLTNAKDSAIQNLLGTVLVVRTTFMNNSSAGSGGAINNDQGSVTVGECTFIHNSSITGGAIANSKSSDSVLVVVRSTFSLNSAEVGGAIYNEGVMTIYTSTLSLNTAKVNGGNIAHLGVPLFSFARIEDSTLSQGQAAQGHGSNIFSQGAPVGVINTIMANPIGSGNCDGPISDLGDNLQWPLSPFPCVGTIADPKLGVLASNGGPTQTLALQPGSAAIDKTLVCGASDQRGILRPQGPHCDIGAYEVIPNMTGMISEIGQFMMNFLPNLPKAGAGKLTQQAIEPLSNSLNPALWQGADGNHLNPQRGQQLFDLHRKVVDNLSELIVGQTQLDYISNLLFADRTLAVVAMGDAGCVITPTPAAPPSAKCAEAAKDLLNGDGKAAAGDYGAAIDSYRAAWGDGT